jgi:alkylation response protein AidB-like acyl-CoA dehydrogenase
MFGLDLTPQQQALTGRFATLARSQFAPRAAHYDQTATFPADDFDDLFKAGLNAPTVPKEHGGLGLGPHRGDAFTLWMITKEIAKSDLSLARCWEGHANSLAILDGMATEDRRRGGSTGRRARRQMGGLSGSRRRAPRARSCRTARW